MNNVTVSGFIVNEPQRGEGRQPDKFRMSVARGAGDSRDSAIIGVSGWFDPDYFDTLNKGDMVVVAGALDWFTVPAKQGEKYDNTVFAIRAYEVGPAIRFRSRDGGDQSSSRSGGGRSNGRSSSRSSRAADTDSESF